MEAYEASNARDWELESVAESVVSSPSSAPAHIAGPRSNAGVASTAGPGPMPPQPTQAVPRSTINQARLNAVIPAVTPSNTTQAQPNATITAARGPLQNRPAYSARSQVVPKASPSNNRFQQNRTPGRNDPLLNRQENYPARTARSNSGSSTVSPGINARPRNGGQPNRSDRFTPNKPNTSVNRHSPLRNEVNSVSVRLPLAKTNWAQPAGLVSATRARDIEEKKRQQANIKSFLRAPIDEDVIMNVGFYLWPSQSEHPDKYFGYGLEKLNDIKIRLEVHIEEMPRERYLKISCPSYHRDAERRITEAINGIRQVVEHYLAKEKRGEPLHIVVPPTATGIRTIVSYTWISPTILVDLAARAGHSENVRPQWKRIRTMHGLKLDGEELPGHERRMWDPKHQELLNINSRRFKDHLTENLMLLAPDKDSMQMRVHFGRIALEEWRKKFKKNLCGFEEFAEMMQDSKMETIFEKEFEGSELALELERGIEAVIPEIFQPDKTKTTAVILMKQDKGESYRVEADIDRPYIDDRSLDREYQLGCVTVSSGRKTNVRVQVRNVDVEKEIDYSLEVLSDNQISEPPTVLLNVIQDSIHAKSKVRKDKHNYDYPEISLSKVPNGWKVTGVEVQSVLKFKLSRSGYIVDLVLHRRWDTIDDKVEPQGEPKMTAGVSMYHPNWEYQMRSYENEAGERGWSPDLKDFFDDGFSEFINEVTIVQNYLARANKVCKERASKDNDKKEDTGLPSDSEEAENFRGPKALKVLKIRTAVASTSDVSATEDADASQSWRAAAQEPFVDLYSAD